MTEQAISPEDIAAAIQWCEARIRVALKELESSTGLLVESVRLDEIDISANGKPPESLMAVSVKMQRRPAHNWG